MPDMRTVVEKLALARDLVASDPLDVAAAMALLDQLPAILSDGAMETVVAAREAVAAVDGNGGHRQSVARYALARVVVALEKALMSDA